MREATASRADGLSYRGTTQPFSTTPFAIWVRNPEGRILESIGKNPAVSLLFGYFEENDRGFMIFRGRARRDDNEAVCKQIYERAHAFEQNKDPDRTPS